MTIVQDEKIRSGKPVIKGTRITVKDIVERFYRLGRSSEEIASDLGIKEKDVETALRYHHNEILETGNTGIEA